MVGWLYIIVRTFPFWAFPMGITLITGALAAKKRRGKRTPVWALVLGVVLILGASAFLALQGHFAAVPFLHDVINDGAQ